MTPEMRTPSLIRTLEAVPRVSRIGGSSVIIADHAICHTNYVNSNDKGVVHTYIANIENQLPILHKNVVKLPMIFLSHWEYVILLITQ